jgi:hypothetical protein
MRAFPEYSNAFHVGVDIITSPLSHKNIIMQARVFTISPVTYLLV